MYASWDLLYDIGGLCPAHLLRDGQLYRVFSAMFLHADTGHLVSNMLLLAGVGAMLEEETGHTAFLLLYFFTGVCGQVASLLCKVANGDWFVVSIGASGAVFGLVGVLFIVAAFFVGKLERVTWQKVLIMAACCLYSVVDTTNIDNAAHIGGYCAGLLSGLVVCILKLRRNRRERKKENGHD